MYDKDTGVDGVIVLGGQEGGTVGATTYKEVWYLDFAVRPDGKWRNITGRFANMDAIGYRREHACACDAATKRFCTWMGRANSKIPQGASYSAGAWCVDLGALGDPNASLTWERLAKDNLPGIKGRSTLPSVWDSVNKRLFVIGGRQGLTEFSDVWAIYPGVTGAACQSLTPHAPFPVTPAPTTAAPTPRPPDTAAACPQIQGFVRAPAITSALANPSSVEGWGQLQNPGIPEGPYNAKRTYLSVCNASIAWDAAFSPLVYKAGCPQGKCPLLSGRIRAPGANGGSCVCDETNARRQIARRRRTRQGVGRRGLRWDRGRQQEQLARRVHGEAANAEVAVQAAFQNDAGGSLERVPNGRVGTQSWPAVLAAPTSRERSTLRLRPRCPTSGDRSDRCAPRTRNLGL